MPPWPSTSAPAAWPTVCNKWPAPAMSTGGWRPATRPLGDGAAVLPVERSRPSPSPSKKHHEPPTERVNRDGGRPPARPMSSPSYLAPVNPARCPVRALQDWLDLASITTGPLLQGVTKANRPPGSHSTGIDQQARPSRSRSSRPRSHPLLRPQPPRRIRHLGPPTRRIRPGHRSPDPPPLPCHPRPVRPHPRGLDRQRRHPVGALSRATQKQSSAAAARPDADRKRTAGSPSAQG